MSVLRLGHEVSVRVADDVRFDERRGRVAEARCSSLRRGWRSTGNARRLLREAGSFEGFGSVQMLVDVDDLAVAQSEVEMEARIDLDSAAPASSLYVGSD